MNVMIIPAAGRGTRLDYSGPKLMFPLGGKPLISYLLVRYQPYVDHFVIVINPKDEQVVENYLISTGYSYEFAYQAEATGMLDAILAPLPQLKNRLGDAKPDQLWISWCDQIGITHQTALAMHQLFDDTDEPCLIFPTIEKPQPYIHMQRDKWGEIIHVMQRREGDDMPEIGENDCGLFGLSATTYFDLLPQFSDWLDTVSSVDNSNTESGVGATTHERNFLPFISWMRGKGTVSTYRAVDSTESIGVNTVEDAEQLISASGGVSQTATSNR